ncbi:hypothetical protein V6N11_027391 [Hibiscus sabdariffa]|uniref:RNase H type-1 domain-containing protein n=1 Tax=Hibiscus sabdariffa TaxID=183260 RepID=A0ABR2PHA7_9ROSI
MSVPKCVASDSPLFLENINALGAYDHDFPPWSCFFPSFPWQVWKRRNDYIFNGECLPLSKVYKIGNVWASPFTTTILATRIQVRLVVCFVIRLVIVSEAIVAWSMGIPHVQVQSDNSVALQMILEPLPASSSFSFVRSISSLWNHPWELSFLRIPREQNMVVDCLPKLPPSLDFQLRINDDIPELIQPLLIQDRNGPPYHRCRRVS